MTTRKGLGQANTFRTNNNTSTGYGVAYADEVSGHRTVANLTALYALNDWQLSASGDNTDNDAIGQLWYVVNADGNGNGCYYQLKDWSKRNEAAGWSIADYTTKAELQDKIDNIATADEEDITTVGDTPQTQVLKLKDRAYDSLNASGKGYKILRKNWQTINGERKNVLTQEMINEPNTIYEIRYDFDLNGAEIQIKEGCILNFVGGSLNNGTIKSSKILFSGNYTGNINVTLNCNNITNNFCIISSDNNIENKIETASNNIILNGDIKLETATKLGTNLYSNNHIITVGIESYIYIYKRDNISINGVIFNKELPPQTVSNYQNKRYILYIDTFQYNLNISNCTFNNGCFAFTHIEKSDTTYGNLKFENNIVNVDYKSWEKHEFVERDLFNIRGISNIMIKNNIIHCENIERVFKISSITNDANYQLQYNIPKNIIIENNIIHSDGYKQLLDGFVGSQNVSLSNNQLIIKNHTRIFEQKSTYQNIPAYLKMNNNYIITNSPLVYVDATSSSIMEMKNNIIKFEEVVDNRVYDFINIRGTNTIIQNNVFSHINDNTSAAFLQVGFSSENKNAPKKIIIKDNDFGEIKGEHILYGKCITYEGNNVKNVRLGTLFECEMLDFMFNHYTSSVYPIRLFHYYNDAPKLTPIVFNIDNISYKENIRLIENLTDYIDTNYILEICNNPNIFISDIKNKQIQLYNYENFGHTTFDNKVYKIGSVGFNKITKKPITKINDKYIDMNGNLYNSLVIGSTQERPTDIRAGFYYFDVSLNRPIWKKDDISNVWVDANGRIADDNYPIATNGTTQQRPTLTSTDEGFEYYDSTLKKKVLWNGTAWVNMDGSSLVEQPTQGESR